MKPTEKFLWDKINTLLDYWKKNGENDSIGRVYRANQVCVTENGNYSFVIYNLCGFLDGHFLFTVNPDTFEYAIRMHAFYGGLTWVTPPTENKIYTRNDFPEELQMKLDAYVAYTLYLCCYTNGVRNVVDLSTQRLVSGKQWYDDLLTVAQS